MSYIPLDEIHLDYSAVAVTDKHLSEDSTLSKGCGGVAILWGKSLAVPLAVQPITSNSDRLCAIHLKDFHLSQYWCILTI